MIGTIKMNTDEGPKEMSFRACGTTKIRYRQVFGRDLDKDLNNLDPDSPDFDGETYDRLAYIMNASAEEKDMTKLNHDTYIEWLEHLEGFATTSASRQIISIYKGNRITTSIAKNQ